MRISTGYGFAFLCNRKCASTSIEHALYNHCNIRISPDPDNPDIKHINARDYCEFISPLLKKIKPQINIDSFCIIREPLDWLRSWYRFRTRDEIKNPAHKYHKNYTGKISFNEFVEAYISKGDRPAFATIKTGDQFDFMKLSENMIGVDYVIPMDDLAKVSQFLYFKTGKKVNIQKANISPKRETSLDPKLKDKLCEHLRKDISIYKFVKSCGVFDKRIHSEKLSALLQACQ